MSARMSTTVRVQPEPGSAAQPDERAGSQGFALILAILALMLLTFLGLTLAATTSTELQIASNYRWSRQAAYNAEAGLEVGKVMLRAVNSWAGILPIARPVGWTLTTPAMTPTTPPGVPLVDLNGFPLRHWESSGCDTAGGQVGYGLVLVDPLTATPLQYVSTPFGGVQQLNGAFTVWVRRDTRLFAGTGQIQDDDGDRVLVMTSEGIAPYQSGINAAGADTFAQAHMAVSVLQLAMNRNGGNCTSDSSQVGASISGSGHDPCARLGGDLDPFNRYRTAGNTGFGSEDAGTGAALFP